MHDNHIQSNGVHFLVLSILPFSSYFDIDMVHIAKKKNPYGTQEWTFHTYAIGVDDLMSKWTKKQGVMILVITILNLHVRSVW